VTWSEPELVTEKGRTNATCPVCSKAYWTRTVRRCCSPLCLAWSYVQEGEADECWQWRGRLSPEGYPTIVLYPSGGRPKNVGAHRILLEHKLGRKLRPAELARHVCPGPHGNRWCCNPRHLEPGSYLDNILDEVRRGYKNCGAPGQGNVNARLTEADVGHILSSKDSSTVLGLVYGVTDSTVRGIRRRETWRHVVCTKPVTMFVGVSINRT
jgi:hypothetical protein